MLGAGLTAPGPNLGLFGAGLTAPGADLALLVVEFTDLGLFVVLLFSFSTILDLNPVGFSFGIPPENNPPKFGGPPFPLEINEPTLPGLPPTAKPPLGFSPFTLPNEILSKNQQDLKLSIL